MSTSTKGTAILEFVLIVPSLVFAFVLLVDSGITLVLRQEGLTAARYAAYYKRASGSEPSAPQVSVCVSPQGEQWNLRPQSSSTGDNILSLAGLADLTGNVFDQFGSLVSGQGSVGEVTYTAQTTPNRGIIPKLLGINSVTGSYTIPTGTFTSDDCGSFASVAAAGIELFSGAF